MLVGESQREEIGLQLAKHRVLVGNSKGKYWDLSTENLEASIKEIRLNSEGSAKTVSVLVHRRGRTRTPRKGGKKKKKRTPRKNNLAVEGKRAWILGKG